MSDAVDDMKAMGAIRKQERADAWANRSADVAKIEAEGFTVRVLSEANRHLRINITGSGWFDFWPSTGRWLQSMRTGGRRGLRGSGVDTLIVALKAVRG